MNILKYFLLFFLCTATGLHVIAQPPAQVDFTYKNKPISPEVLMPYFPALQDSTSQDVADLTHGLLYHGGFDTVWSSSLTWLKPGQRKNAYNCSMDFGFISYIVLGKIAPNRFVVFACMDRGDRTPTRYYIFVIDKEGDKLVKTWALKTDNSRNSAITIKGNTITDHDKSYLIPTEKK